MNLEDIKEILFLTIVAAIVKFFLGSNIKFFDNSKDSIDNIGKQALELENLRNELKELQKKLEDTKEKLNQEEKENLFYRLKDEIKHETKEIPIINSNSDVTKE